MRTSKPEGSARERLLAAANELFYEEGVHTVGIDRVIERAGVAKASLYSAFGSKEALVLAYLALRAERRQARIEARIALYDDPRAKILAIFDVLQELISEPKFRGCAFVNACAEGPRDESRVNEASVNMRAWTRRLFIQLAQQAGAGNGEQLGRQLALLYDGAIVSASVDREPEAASNARLVAEWLLDARVPATAVSARSAKVPAKKSRPRRATTTN
jgi:AcrR family transcriptional regulator